MGNSSSAPAQVTVQGTQHGPLPEDSVPYNGSTYEYRIVQVLSNIRANATFGFTAGKAVQTSDVQSYYNSLQQQYGEYYRMSTFFQVPLARSAKAFSTSAQIPFQGIFSRPTVYTPSEEKWQLHVEQSAIQLSIIRSGSLFTMGHPALDENMGDVYNKILQNAQAGGKFICMECSGSVASQGFSFGSSPYFGVDIFFEKPLHSNPTLYTYTAFSTPMYMQYDFSGVHVQCDWNGTLAAHLDQGWKLVDIFIAQQETDMLTTQRNRDHHHYPRELNTIWFFEKEVQRGQDLTPRFQATYVEYYMPYSVGFGKINAHLELGPLLSEMGKRGWELICVLDTPQTSRNGSFSSSGTRSVIVFFQRPIQLGVSVAGPQAIDFANTPPT